MSKGESATLRIVALFASGPAQDPNTGEIGLDLVTRTACGEAVRCASSTHTDIILVTTGIVDKRMRDVYRGFKLGQKMAERIQVWLNEEKLPTLVVYRPGWKFNTYGEISAVMRYVREEWLPTQPKGAKARITFMAADTHAWRARWLVTILAAHYRLPRSWFAVMPYNVSTQDFTAERLKMRRRRIFRHEVCGWAKSLIYLPLFLVPPYKPPPIVVSSE